MVAGILDLIHTVYGTVSPLIAVRVMDGCQPPAAVGAEYIAREHCLPLGAHGDVALLLVLPAALLHDIHDPAVGFVTPDPECL